MVALWIVGMATTLIGAYVGGSLAGALPGNPRRGIGAVHGFLAWCVALLLTFGTHVALLRGAVATATGAALDMATSVAPGPGEAGGNEKPGPAVLGVSAARAGQTALAVVVGPGWSGSAPGPCPGCSQWPEPQRARGASGYALPTRSGSASRCCANASESSHASPSARCAADRR